MFTWRTELWRDIRFWIFLFFLIRLIGITNAPLEVAHNWRQSAVNTIARNFEEIDANIFYPRFDTAGAASGISGTEFPVFNYLIFLANLLFGYSHWYGRLINLIISSLGIYFFHKLVKRYFNEDVALLASLILLTSLWFSFSRKIMPDTFSLSLATMGLYFGLFYLEGSHKINLFWYVLLTSLGLLSKIPSAIIPAMLVLPILSKSFVLKRKLILALVSLIPLLLSGWWYFYWFDHITTDYQLFRMGPGPALGFQQLIAEPMNTLNNFYFDALKFSGFVLFVVGLVYAMKNRDKRLLVVLGVSFSSFSVFMLQAGYGFRIHEYYTLPFVPFMALVAGYGVSMVNNHKLRYFLLAFIMIEGVANQQHDFFVKPNKVYKLEIESFLDQHIPADPLIVINAGRNPQLMYFAHRRGWSVKPQRARDLEFLKEVHAEGARYLIWDKNLAQDFPQAFSAIASNDDLVIFDLERSLSDQSEADYGITQ